MSAKSSVGHGEPDAAIDPTNPVRILVASQAEIHPRVRVAETYFSVDGGLSWHDNGELPLPHTFVQAADTTVVFSPHGLGFVGATAVGAEGGGYASRVTHGGIFVWRTRDAGRTFEPPVPVFTASSFQDHPWLTWDLHDRGGTLDVVWANDHGIVFSRSADQGEHFSAPTTVVTNPAAMDPVVATTPTGQLLVFFEEIESDAIAVRMVASHDHGATFSPAVLVGTAREDALPGTASKANTLTPLFGVATDPVTSDVYAAITSVDRTAGHATINLWRSHDGGHTWSPPLRLPSAGGGEPSQTEPRITIAPHIGVEVLYLALARNGLLTPTIVRSTDRGLHFGVRAILPTGCTTNQWLGDYQAILTTPTHTLAIWNGNNGTGPLGILSSSLNNH